jgi:hypothetical protein
MMPRSAVSSWVISEVIPSVLSVVKSAWDQLFGKYVSIIHNRVLECSIWQGKQGFYGSRLGEPTVAERSQRHWFAHGFLVDPYGTPFARIGMSRSPCHGMDCGAGAGQHESDGWRSDGMV